MAKVQEERKYWNEKIETMPRPELEKLQLERLKEIVKFSYENSPYYKRSFDAAGVSPDDIHELSDLAKFPFINKQTERETQGVGSFLGELCCVPEEEVVFISSSSGSTGVPTISPFTQEDFDEFQDTESRWFWQVGMRPKDRYIHALNFSLYVGGPDVIGAQNLGALCIWGGTLPSERLLFVLKTYQPTIIWTSPSYAWYLGETAKKNGIDPKKDLSIRTIIVAGEMGGSIDTTRKAIEDLWGAKVYDFYGLSDIYGACAAMCDAKDGLHIAEDQIYVETVDIHTGEVIPNGEVGELVYTTLRKKARPMIRFRTGDIGRIDQTPCSCGRTHGRIHILGRKDDMFIVSAVNVFPSDIEAVIRGIKGITGEYLVRIYEKDLTCKYNVEVEKNADNNETDEELAARVSTAIKARVGVKPYAVVVHPDGGLNTRSEHKSKRIIDERNLTYNI
ncbi:phenylacetate--CoA ligase [Ruminobacter sp.]|mgnify:CR=1 FL=1|jgi:phenylacetate-CoA ligase|uniref:phenylacetate--CoA ligase family protein n=1 Tax=Ruminobacter sp. TaxID=2774296 RepID=UPI001B50B142|nr:phenylacetate--CoA ligase [Ruminobacter sp.]MBP3749276.1 phenylacetate--CoA ligase [Ruminobacter sp.]